jgi:hypothetical protein
MRSLQLGEFRLARASYFRDLLDDPSRHDDELVRIQQTDGSQVRISGLAAESNTVPIGPVTYRSEIHTDYLILCFCTICDDRFFADFRNSDACLIVHKVDEFSEQLHAQAESQLPGWIGCDGAVTYGAPNALGPVFSKPLSHVDEREWRFAWLPVPPASTVEHVFIRIGSIEALAEVRSKTG